MKTSAVKFTGLLLALQALCTSTWANESLMIEVGAPQVDTMAMDYVQEFSSPTQRMIIAIQYGGRDGGKLSGFQVRYFEVFAQFGLQDDGRGQIHYDYYDLEIVPLALTFNETDQHGSLRAGTIKAQRDVLLGIDRMATVYALGYGTEQGENLFFGIAADMIGFQIGLVDSLSVTSPSIGIETAHAGMYVGAQYGKTEAIKMRIELGMDSRLGTATQFDAFARASMIAQNAFRLYAEGGNRALNINRSDYSYIRIGMARLF